MGWMEYRRPVLTRLPRVSSPSLTTSRIVACGLVRRHRPFSSSWAGLFRQMRAAKQNDQHGRLGPQTPVFNNINANADLCEAAPLHRFVLPASQGQLATSFSRRRVRTR